MSNRWITIIVVVIIITVGGYFAAKAIKRPTAPTPSTTQTSLPSASESSTNTSTTSAVISPTEVKEITVTGTDFVFTPSAITVKTGQPVKVTFKDNGKYPHNFTVSQLQVQTNTIQPGEETSIQFTPTKTGQFTYICTVPGHADRGMKGTLIVE